MTDKKADRRGGRGGVSHHDVQEDIEKLVEIEEKLFFLATIADSTDDAVYGKSLDGAIRSWNRGAEKMYGYSAEEVLGENVSMLAPKGRENESADILKRMASEGKIVRYETERVRKSGEAFPAAITVSPIWDRSGKIIGASSIARDITEARENERRREAFVGMASHELKTPVTSVKLYADTLYEAARARGDTEVAAYAGAMRRQTERLSRLVSDLLDVSRIHSGKLAMKRRAFDLVRMVRESAREAGIFDDEVSVNIRGPSSLSVRGDKERLRQVVVNFLSNAVRYAPGSPIDISISSNPGWATVSVTDKGSGIRNEDKSRIFESFYQAKRGTPSGGLGMGLYISREIVERHGGKIGFRSNKGKGATFYFAVPRSKR